MYDFIALDVETANEDYSSICQVGLAFVENGEVTGCWGTYVNPQCRFTNTRIHGINEETVVEAPKIDQVFRQLKATFEGHLVAHHTHFDRTAITKVSKKLGSELPRAVFFDSARLAQRAINRYNRSGYGLSNLCKDYGIPLADHHDAVADAIAAARVTLKVLAETNKSIYYWLPVASGGLQSPLDNQTNTSVYSDRHYHKSNIEIGSLNGIPITQFKNEVAYLKRNGRFNEAEWLLWDIFHAAFMKAQIEKKTIPTWITKNLEMVMRINGTEEKMDLINSKLSLCQ